MSSPLRAENPHGAPVALMRVNDRATARASTTPAMMRITRMDMARNVLPGPRRSSRKGRGQRRRLMGLKDDWQQFRSAKPGRRFIEQFETNQQERASKWIRLALITLGAVVVLIGLVALP